MLTELRIADLGVIEEAVIHPAEGLTVVTGETGAGKTMVVTGLGLVAGVRPDTGIVRAGRAKAQVEARFAPLADAVAAQVEELGGVLDGGELLIVRHVAPGRSRAWVAGTGVPAAVAARVGADLVTVHGQSEQVRLGSPARQREVLDRAAGEEVARLLSRYTTAYEARQRLRGDLESLTANRLERAREADWLRLGLKEIERVAPQPGEDEALRAEARRLQDADDLRLAVEAALVAVAGDDSSGEGSALTALAAARAALRKAAVHDERVQSLEGQVEELAVLAADLTAAAASYLADLDSDTGRLEQIAARLAELRPLTRKYGQTADEVLVWAGQTAARLADLEGSDDRTAALEAEARSLDAELDGLAARLTALRQATAAAVSGQVESELRDLALPKARIEFAVSDLGGLGPVGRDAVNILFSAHPGAPLAPLGKAASGGELSRVRLALEVVLAGCEDPATLVFDEVDAGIGGAVGTEIGRRLARLARLGQVIVVTHLAQVAAFADRHYAVAKDADGAVTATAARLLEDAERPAELARMMGGRGDSASAQAHARELLGLAAAVKAAF
ncbi:MAG: DNA repair protein RecN [Propionibacteriaceae bacterium]|nr:DNA repair protein RecN [Propionibacteriaceae bacterium]